MKETTKPLNILIAASEMYPFAKIGGLGDVVSSLSSALKQLGHDVRVVLPRYSSINLDKVKAGVLLEPMGVWMGNKEEWCSVYEAKGPGNVPVYMIEHKVYFDRPGLYHDPEMKDYDDNACRFGFLSRAALQLCKSISFKPDIVHGNDWQTSLLPAYVKIWHWNDPLLGGAASVLTLHSAAYQGIYPKNCYEYLGLGWSNFTIDKFESYDKVNLLKGGIHYADMVVAVSPSFARELLTQTGGFGLSSFLSNKGELVTGILNGIDYAIWDPQTDQYLPSHYSSADLSGKKECKQYVQKLFDLKQDPGVCLIGAIGRFVPQKGFGLIAEKIERILDNMKVQFVILGTGEYDPEHFFGELPKQYGTRAGSYIGFDAERAHMITAGCDFLLMPSLFEPCGLNQMYAMHYGTLPIVRAVGGLDDTVENYDETTGTGTGFKFYESSGDALYNTVSWAVSTYYDRPSHIESLMHSAMTRDFSWESSAKQYVTVYRKAIEEKRRQDEGYRPYYW